VISPDLVTRDGRPIERTWRIAAQRLGISLDAYREHRERGERWCVECQQWRPAEQFGPRRSVCRQPLESRAAIGGAS
jgi:hypothetical protein